MSSSSKAVVEKMFAAFAEKDIDKILETVSTESVWIYHGTQVIPKSKHEGRKGARTFFSNIFNYTEILHFTPRQYIVQDNMVVVLGNEHQRIRSSGKEMKINTSSIAGKMGMAHLSHYAASKFAVIGFSNSIAKEVALEGNTVNCICPGIVGTGMWRGEGGIADKWKLEGETEEESWERNKKTLIPQGVDQKPEDIARAVVFISKSPRITGQAIAVDGGITL